MQKTTIIGALITALILATPTLAFEQESRTLDVEADGVAEHRETGDQLTVELDLEGDVTVTSSGEGVDRTAFTSGPTVTITVTLDETSYDIPVTIGGEGVSLVQTGVTADGWRLSAQGSTFGDDAQFRGELTLIGNDDGYAVSGDGVLTVTDGDATANYGLNYAGQGTFE